MPFSVTDDFFCHRSRCWIQAVYWSSAQHGGGKAGGKYSIHQSCQRSWQQTTYTHSHTGPYPCRFQLPWRPNQPRSSLPRTLACVDFSVWYIWNFALSHGKHWQTLWFNTGINCSHFKYTTLPFHVDSFQLMSLAVLVSLPSLSEVDSRVARGFPSTLWVGSCPGGFITIHELGNSITECNNTAMWQGCEETALGWMIWIYRTQMRGVSSIALLSDLLKYPLGCCLSYHCVAVVVATETIPFLPSQSSVSQHSSRNPWIEERSSQKKVVFERIHEQSFKRSMQKPFTWEVLQTTQRYNPTTM